jgi:hypothetical protein
LQEEYLRTQAELEAQKEQVTHYSLYSSQLMLHQAQRALELEAEQKNQIIQQLEEEKRKIEADVESLKVHLLLVLCLDMRVCRAQMKGVDFLPTMPSSAWPVRPPRLFTPVHPSLSHCFS